MQPGGVSVEWPRKTKQGIHVGQQSELSSTRIVVILNNLQSVVHAQLCHCNGEITGLVICEVPVLEMQKFVCS